jgi:hypothetical protein
MPEKMANGEKKNDVSDLRTSTHITNTKTRH